MLDVTMQRAQLSASLKAVRKVIPSRFSLPVITSVRMETLGGALKMTGTDLDAYLTVSLGAEPAGTGVVVVNASALGDVLKGVPQKQAVRLWASEEGGAISLNVASGALSLKLPTLGAEEFPTAPEVAVKHCVRVSGADLAAVLNLTGSCASVEDSRPILNGVLLELGKVEGSKHSPAMRAVATNGHRLSMATVAAPDVPPTPKPVKGHPAAPWQLILSPVAVEALATIDLPESVLITWGDGPHAIISGTGYSLTTRLVDGPYPHYTQVIPRNNDKTAVIDRAALGAVLARMRPAFKASQTKRLTVELNGAAELRAHYPDFGDITETVPATYYGPSPFRIGFNGDYLTQLLKLIESERVRFTFSTSERAAVLTPDTGGAVEHSMLLMPLRLVD